MQSNVFDRSIVSKTGHRPWPMPAAPWLMTQSWHNLLFAHWRVDVSALRKIVPATFELDLFKDEAWVGIVPFYMTNVGLRGTPSLPWLSSFPELNVRTYVRVADRPGVYFFSLDAGRWPAVTAARTLLNLPYFRATMRVETSRDRVLYQSARRGQSAAVFRAEYGPRDQPFTAAEGSLDYFSPNDTVSTTRLVAGSRTVSRFITRRGPCRWRGLRCGPTRWPSPMAFLLAIPHRCCILRGVRTRSLGRQPMLRRDRRRVRNVTAGGVFL